jgi:hypothetical protein
VVLTPGSVVLTPGSVVLTPGSVVLTPGSGVLTPGSVILTPDSVVLTPGSVVLIFSAFHLANVGISQYAAYLVEAKRIMDEKVGRETIFQPLPPILLVGTDRSQLIRSIVELNAWTDDYYGSKDRFLEDSHKVARETLQDQGEGSVK